MKNIVLIFKFFDSAKIVINIYKKKKRNNLNISESKYFKNVFIYRG